MRVVGPLVCLETGETVVQRLWVADGFWSRFRGLQFRKSLPLGEGLLLVPCTSVHTAFLRFPLDVVTLDQNGKVMEVVPNLRPWKVFIPKTKPHAILELPSKTVTFPPGSRLSLHPLGCPKFLPISVQFLQFDCNKDG